MTPNPGKPRRSGSETGVMPRVDAEPQVQYEPPQPRTLPEFDDDVGGITGRIPLTTEGEDEAKQSDDSTTSASVL